eukprot:scaffold10862_cov98-Isochrysis_galbana.AAC.1
MCCCGACATLPSKSKPTMPQGNCWTRRKRCSMRRCALAPYPTPTPNPIHPYSTPGPAPNPHPALSHPSPSAPNPNPFLASASTVCRATNRSHRRPVRAPLEVPPNHPLLNRESGVGRGARERSIPEGGQ